MSPYSISPAVEMLQCCPLVKMSLIMMEKRTIDTFLTFETSVAGSIQARIFFQEKRISPFYPFTLCLLYILSKCLCHFSPAAALLSIVFFFKCIKIACHIQEKPIWITIHTPPFTPKFTGTFITFNLFF